MDRWMDYMCVWQNNWLVIEHLGDICTYLPFFLSLFSSVQFFNCFLSHKFKFISHKVDWGDSIGIGGGQPAGQVSDNI